MKKSTATVQPKTKAEDKKVPEKLTVVKAYFANKIAKLQEKKSEHEHNLYNQMKRQQQLSKEIRLLKEEYELLTQPASLVATVLRKLNEDQVLVKAQGSKFIVESEDNISFSEVEVGQRVALRASTLQVHKVFRSKVDPLIESMVVENAPAVTFDMIGGLQSQISQIREVIELPITHPDLYEACGIKPPKGVLLHGPPGTGKTMLVRALANHTKSSFLRINGTELVQKFIGEGTRLVRELFALAKLKAPSIIFMDEVDAIGYMRPGNGDSEVQRTMMELLSQLDGFSLNEQIKVIMATNRIDMLDPALLRPGRIDRKIEFPPPNDKAREEILNIHANKMNLATEVDLSAIAEKMSGANGAELKAICTEAGIMALRERRTYILQHDFEVAVEKVQKSMADPSSVAMAGYK